MPAPDDTDLIRPGTLIPSVRPSETIGREAISTTQPVGSGLDIGDVLGEGGMGIVRRATQRALGREVAVKSLRPGVRSPSAARLLLQEAWATGALEHPNIVPIYTITEDAGGHPLIVLKRIDGLPWRALMRDPDAVAARLGEADLVAWNLRVLEEVCRAVHFAHTRGILHRDLKPSNVMIDALGEVYLMDWGLAASLDPQHGGRIPLASRQNRLAGTPHYMAPEMLLQDGRCLSEKTDLYLLGAILYEILTGRAPHAVSEDTAAVIASIPTFEPSFAEDVPPILSALCARALSADPADRPESAQAFARVLSEFQTQRGAAYLVEEAQEHLARLRAHLSEPGAERIDVYRQLGACRFGFQQALRVWPEHPPALRGLEEAIAAMVRYELREASVPAAEALLSELTEPPPALLAAISARRAALAQQAALDRRRQDDTDPTLGQRTRVFAGVLVGVIWTALPIAGWWFAPVPLSNAGLMWFTGAILFGLAVLVTWGWDSLTKTAYNRRIVGALVAAPAAEFFLAGWAMAVGLRAEHTLTASILLWALDAVMVAIAVEPRILPAAVGYLLAFLAGTLWPEQVLLAAAGGNLGLLLTVLWGWGWPARRELLRRRESA